MSPSSKLRARALAICLSFAASATACSRAASEPDVKLEWTIRPSPPVVGPATVELVLTDPSGRPIRSTAVRVEGNMSHPGMAPSIARAEEIAPGRYRAALSLTMAGEWFLLVEAGLPDGRTLERTVRLPAVRGR